MSFCSCQRTMSELSDSETSLSADDVVVMLDDDSMSSSNGSEMLGDSDGRNQEQAHESQEDEGENQIDHSSVDAAVRDHLYLPGTSNPLFPSSLLQKRREQQQTTRGLQELAILELEAIVLFPDSTLPLRLRHSPWVDYLGRQVDASRELIAPNEEVRIGVITHVPTFAEEQQRRRSSWFRTSFTAGSGVRHDALLMMDSLDDDEDNNDTAQEHETEQNQIENEEVRERNEVPVEGASVALSAVEQDQFLLQVEESLDKIDDTVNSATGALEALGEPPYRERDFHDAVRIYQYAGELQRNLFTFIGATARLPPEICDAAIYGAVVPKLVRLKDLVHKRKSIGFRILRLKEQHEQAANRDRLIGRIGTIATISYTFDETSASVLDVGSSLSSRRRERNELVVTALGTNRFRIVSRVQDDDTVDLGRERRFFVANDMSQVRLYSVEELPNRGSPLPPIFLRSRRAGNSVESDMAYFNRHEQMIQKISQVSSIPYMAYKGVWPWRLVALIRSALDRIPSFEGLRKKLPSLDTNNALLEPTLFSFWMASNMSLKEEEKLELIKMRCTVERLQLILRKVLEQKENEASVCCKACNARLSSASSMFSVGGAEGTTGAYVNEYGVIHQTITLREAIEERLNYSGGPETRDSWFPGYAWTITYCQRCHSHLGWRFDLVRADAATEDRPEHFFGWSSSSVTFLSSG